MSQPFEEPRRHFITGGCGFIGSHPVARARAPGPPGAGYATAPPRTPLSLDGPAKLACEALISAYNHLFGINANVFRFANVVGGRMGHGVTYDFLGKLKRDPQNLEIDRK